VLFFVHELPLINRIYTISYRSATVKLEKTSKIRTLLDLVKATKNPGKSPGFRDEIR
jgi:hypothetical protein